MKASRNYENLNKHFESCLEPVPGTDKFKAYLCPSRIWTVGWGSTTNMDTGKPVTEETIIDQATADRWFTLETAEKLKGVLELMPIILTQDELDAILSFSYNVGIEAFKTSTFRKRILAGENKQLVAKEEMPRWHHGSQGQDLDGLKRRRRAEVALFCGDYETVKNETYGKVICVKQEATPVEERKVGWFEARLILKPEGWSVGVIAKLAGSDTNYATAEIPVQMDLVKKFTSEFGEHDVVLAANDKPWPGAITPPKPNPQNGVYLEGVPFFPQLDNPRYPTGTCNVTSVAMVLAYYGIKPQNPAEQLEMEVLRWMENNGLDRHVHMDLQKAMEHYGLKSRFTTEATIAQIKEHILNYGPCILSGMFTSSGHIIVITGFDDTGLWVNDPYGEYFSPEQGGYQKEPIATRGKHQHYSYNLIRKVSDGDGSIWCHFPRSPNLA